jgi:hypothetical protein
MRTLSQIDSSPIGEAMLAVAAGGWGAAGLPIGWEGMGLAGAASSGKILTFVCAIC